MTYQLIDRRTRKQVSSGLTLALAAYYCQQDAALVLLPDRH